MKKILIIGDCHGRSLWKLIVSQHKDFSKIVMVGDYFDTHDDISGIEQLHNFNEICKFKEEHGDKVVLLVGNHDHHYFPEIGYTGTSGYQSNMKTAFEAAINDNRDKLQMCHQFDDVICSHAGVSIIWLRNQGWDGQQNIAEFVNEVWKHRPDTFCFTPSHMSDSSGDSSGQTPIWIRPRALMVDNQEIKKDYIQIMGHTQMRKLDIEGKATGGRYYFIDTLGTSGEYLIYEDRKFSVGNTK